MDCKFICACCGREFMEYDVEIIPGVTGFISDRTEFRRFIDTSEPRFCNDCIRKRVDLLYEVMAKGE